MALITCSFFLLFFFCKCFIIEQFCTIFKTFSNNILFFFIYSKSLLLIHVIENCAWERYKTTINKYFILRLQVFMTYLIRTLNKPCFLEITTSHSIVGKYCHTKKRHQGLVQNSRWQIKNDWPTKKSAMYM